MTTARLRSFYMVVDSFGRLVEIYTDQQRAERVASGYSKGYVIELTGYRP